MDTVLVRLWLLCEALTTRARLSKLVLCLSPLGIPPPRPGAPVLLDFVPGSSGVPLPCGPADALQDWGASVAKSSENPASKVVHLKVTTLQTAFTYQMMTRM